MALDAAPALIFLWTSPSLSSTPSPTPVIEAATAAAPWWPEFVVALLSAIAGAAFGWLAHRQQTRTAAMDKRRLIAEEERYEFDLWRKERFAAHQQFHGAFQDHFPVIQDAATLRIDAWGDVLAPRRPGPDRATVLAAVQAIAAAQRDIDFAGTRATRDASRRLVDALRRFDQEYLIHSAVERPLPAQWRASVDQALEDDGALGALRHERPEWTSALRRELADEVRQALAAIEGSWTEYEQIMRRETRLHADDDDRRGGQ